MNVDASESISVDWAGSWQTWIFLHHLLPANLLRQLLASVVPILTSSRFEFADLFEENICADVPHLGMWQLTPKVVNCDIAFHVQHQLRALVWSNDASMSVPPEEKMSNSYKTLMQFSSALELARTDLSIADQEIDQTRKFIGDQNFGAILDVFRALHVDGRRPLNGVTSELFNVAFVGFPKELRMVAIKHFGDLLADVDEWSNAIFAYELVQKELAETEAIDCLLTNLYQVNAQSIATAYYVLNGPNKAAEIYEKIFSASPYAEQPLLFANATHERLIAQYRSIPEPEFAPDRRSACLAPPLLISSHDLGSALRDSIFREYRTSHRNFWAVLRRQFALGSDSVRRETQSLYGASLLDMVRMNEDLTSQKAFEMAVELLIKGGDSKFITSIDWSDIKLNHYINDNLISSTIALQCRHPGVWQQRAKGLVALFGSWLKQLDAGRTEIADNIINYVITLARQAGEDGNFQPDLFKATFKLLTELVANRPEFSKLRINEIGTLFLNMLAQSERDNGKYRSVLLKATFPYLEYFDDILLGGVLNGAFILLDQLDATGTDNAIVGDALAILYNPRTLAFSNARPEYGEKVIGFILRFGLTTNVDSANFLAHLQSIPVELVDRYDLAGQLSTVVDSVIAGSSVEKVNCSVSIQALLLVPRLAGTAGIKVALSNLDILIDSITGKTGASLMVEAYAPLRILSERIDELRTLRLMPSEEFEKILRELYKKLERLWEVGVVYPLIFTSFSIPRKTVAESALVHNWALSTLEFAKALGAHDLAKQMLRAARSTPSLTRGIDLAFGTLYSWEIQPTLEIDIEHLLLMESPDFYDALGRFLQIYSNLVEKCDKAMLLNALIESVMRYGPREADIGVLVIACNASDGLAFNLSALKHYEKRVRNSGARMLLEPFVFRLGRSGPNSFAED